MGILLFLKQRCIMYIWLLGQDRGRIMLDRREIHGFTDIIYKKKPTIINRLFNKWTELSVESKGKCFDINEGYAVWLWKFHLIAVQIILPLLLFISWKK